MKERLDWRLKKKSKLVVVKPLFLWWPCDAGKRSKQPEIILGDRSSCTNSANLGKIFLSPGFCFIILQRKAYTRCSRRSFRLWHLAVCEALSKAMAWSFTLAVVVQDYCRSHPADLSDSTQNTSSPSPPTFTLHPAAGVVRLEPGEEVPVGRLSRWEHPLRAHWKGRKLVCRAEEGGRGSRERRSERCGRARSGGSRRHWKGFTAPRHHPRVLSEGVAALADRKHF